MGTRVTRFDDLTGEVSDEVTEQEIMVGEDVFKPDLAPRTLAALRKAFSGDASDLWKLAPKQSMKQSSSGKPKRNRAGDGEWSRARAWARANGKPVGDRGNPGKDILRQYRASQGA